MLLDSNWREKFAPKIKLWVLGAMACILAAAILASVYQGYNSHQTGLQNQVLAKDNKDLLNRLITLQTHFHAQNVKTQNEITALLNEQVTEFANQATYDTDIQAIATTLVNDLKAVCDATGAKCQPLVLPTAATASSTATTTIPPPAK